MTGEDRRIALGLFVLAFVTYAYFFGGGGWNANAHFDLTRALVERGTLHIDDYAANSGDVSRVGDHVYINKPPGASVLAVIAYAPLYALERALGMSADSWTVLTFNAWVVTAFTCGLTGALIPAVLYLYLRRRADVAPLRATTVAVVTAFGTILFPFSTVFFTHVPSALFLLLAFVLLDERPLLAGICAGIAGTCFYFCIAAAAVLFVGARARRLRFAAGGIPFGILLAIYHYVCFGSPFRTSLEVSTQFTEPGLIFGVFRLPSPGALWAITFSEYRGLFFVCPVLLLAFIGAARGAMRRELVMIAAIAAIFFFGNASFNAWHAGATFGPRYVLAAIPLIAIPLAFVRARYVAALGVLSIAMNFIAAAVDPLPDASIVRPLRDYLLPAFTTGTISEATRAKLWYASRDVGHVGIARQSFDEFGPYTTYKPDSREVLWASFNVGEFITGPRRLASVVPIVLWMCACVTLFCFWSRSRPSAAPPSRTAAIRPSP